MDRARNLDRLAQDFDILIVGGGATGLGCAVDAASRGYRTALLEAGDFGWSTSSRSTKLIHGGLRYLAQGRVHLVREALRERAILRRIARPLVSEVRIVIPTTGWYDRAVYGAGVRLYDLLGQGGGFARGRTLSRDETLARVPRLAPARIDGGILFADGQFDDARYAIALARTADALGAAVVNYIRVFDLARTKSGITGVIAQDLETGDEFVVHARSVVNATGVYADRLRFLSHEHARRAIIASRGSHLVFSNEVLGGNDGFLIPRTDDGRVIFALPWLGRTLVGTTDIPVPSIEPDPLPARDEIEYLIAHLNRYLDAPVTKADVLSAFAGLRPLPSRALGKSTGSLSRRHHVELDQHGLVSVIGGKWTAYRTMAEDAVDLAARSARLGRAPSRTATMMLRGTAIGGDSPEELAVYAARHEMARTVDDVLARRTRVLPLDVRAARAAAPACARVLAKELGRSPQWEREQIAAFQARADTLINLIEA
ncbi:MAG: glycerol-3-phosphate dehydrogenase/oxidase [Candidatus Eremiobacteraeota bacterium]|nr:glycerol-3-phosphate dehydrogenase/oxidase [Candidatus Eremiobacteraeota bacterium]